MPKLTVTFAQYNEIQKIFNEVDELSDEEKEIFWNNIHEDIYDDLVGIYDKRNAQKLMPEPEMKFTTAKVKPWYFKES